MSALDTTVQAIIGLSRPQDTSKANEYLTQFELQAAAWEVAHQLLTLPSSNNNNFRFFGAKILYSKIQKDLSQLQHDQVLHLKELIIKNILELSSDTTSIDMTVIRYLCLSMSALAVQLDQADIVQQILTWCNPIVSTAPMVLLELLTVLPEECYNRHTNVDYNNRDSLSKQLYDSSHQVYAFLDNLLNSLINKPEYTKVVNSIFHCYDSWIINTATTSHDLILNSIFAKCFTLAANTAHTEQIIEVIISGSYKYTTEDTQFAEMLLYNVIIFKPIWAKQLKVTTKNDEHDLFRAITRLFTELAERFIDVLVSQSFNQQILAEIMAQLLECLKFPFSVEIARIPLKFFYDLSLYVSNASNDDGGTSASSQLVVVFSSYYTALIHIAVQQMLLPLSLLHPASATASATNSKDIIPSDINADRIEWRESIGDCKEVLGHHACMAILCTIIQQHHTAHPPNWQHIEAALSGMIFIAPKLPDDEKEFVPQILQFISSIPNILAVQITGISLIGKLSKWLVNNPAYLTSAVNLLLVNLRVTPLSTPASEALMLLLKSYNSNVRTEVPLQDVLNLITELRHSNSISLTADLNMIEGISYIISTYPQATCNSYLQALSHPIIVNLSELIQSTVPHNTAIIANIDRLTTIVRYTRVTYSSGEHPILSLFIQVQPLCERILAVMTSESTYEKVCRFYKYAIRCISAHFAQFLPAMCSHLTQLFTARQYSPVLYAASILVSEFGTAKGKFDDLLYSMLWKLSDVFFAHFSNLIAFENSPDVVEGVFPSVGEIC